MKGWVPGLAGLIALAGAAACAPSETTAVRLTVSYETSWELEELGVTAGERAERTEPRRQLRVLLPDDMAGGMVTIEVDGLRGGARVAHGAVDVVPVLHGEVEAHVALARLPCGAWCTPGATECRGDAVVTCEADADGCPAWSAAAPCGDDTPYCSLGVCAAECIHECAAGETRCDGSGQVRSCGQGDADDCLDWLAPVACADGQVCSNGACADACTDECTAGAVTCAGDGTRRCGDLDADGCTEWGPTQPCPDGQTCSSGACSADCSDDCSEATCEGLVHRACGNYDMDACLDLSPGTSCVPADACREGACDAAAGCSSVPMVCELPPDPVCIDDDTVRVYDAAGTCSGGTCSYAHTDTTCSRGCIDGACACELGPWSSESADSGHYVLGGASDIAVTPAGVVHVGYYADSLMTYKVQLASRSGTGPWSTATADDNYVSLGWIALVLDGSTKRLIYQVSNDLVMTSQSPGDPWEEEIVHNEDNAAHVGAYPSAWVDGDGGLHLAYYHGWDEDLLYAYRPAGSSAWTIEIVDSAATPYPGGTGIAVDASDRRHIVYVRGAELWYATRTSTGAWTRSAIDSEGYIGEGLSMAMDAAGNLHVSYTDLWGAPVTVKYASRPSGGSWTTAVIDALHGGTPAAIAVEPGGAVHVCYYDQDAQDLRYRQRSSGGVWSTSETVDAAGAVGYACSVAATADAVHIAYVDGTNHTLMHASRRCE